MAITTEAGSYEDFGVSDSRQSFTIPHDGIYKLEVWGFQGAAASSIAGGKGGYSVGYIKLSKDDVIYIDCGSNSTPGPARSSVNYSDSTTDAGGNTHTGTNRLGAGGMKTQMLKGETLLIVAGGGGGAHYGTDRNEGSGSTNTYRNVGGGGGGLSGEDGDTNFSSGGATGGTQDSDGIDESNTWSGWASNYRRDGGYGDGYHRGGNGRIITVRAYGSSAGGGSGYIGGVPEIENAGVKYSPSTVTAEHEGDGAARITYEASSGIYNLYHNDIQIKNITGKTINQVTTNGTIVFKP